MSRPRLLPLACALALGLPALAQAIPARPEQLTFQAPDFKAPRTRDHRAQLRNGIPVFLAPSPDGTPLVRLSVSWKGGAVLDPKGHEGRAAFATQLLVNGGTTTLTPDQLEAELAQVAASLTAQPSDRGGTLSLECLDRDFNALFPRLLDVLQNPGYETGRLDLARKAALQRLERQRDSVASIAPVAMAHLRFGTGHPFAAQPTAASLNALTREALQAAHAQVLHPANLVVTVSGKVDRKAVLELLDRTLGRLKPAPQAAPAPAMPAPTAPRTPGITLVDQKAPQAMVQWALPGLRRTDPDWHAAVVMNQLLGGGGFASRLMRTLRSNEGLTYGVRTQLEEGPDFQGDLTGSTQTSNTTVAYLLRLTLQEMERLRMEPASEADLKVIKDALVESFPARWSSRQAIVSTFAAEHLDGWKADWWQDYRQKIQAVTAADVQRLARRLLDPSRMMILAVGDAQAMEAGSPDKPGRLQDLAGLPVRRLALGDVFPGKS